MANKERAEVEIRLNGQVHKLRYGFNELCELEQELGLPFQEVTTKANASFLRAALWIGMRKRQRKLTIEQVGNMLHGQTLEDRTEHITTLVNALMLSYTGQTLEELGDDQIADATEGGPDDGQDPLAGENTGTS
jgi:hypothetical protein